MNHAFDEATMEMARLRRAQILAQVGSDAETSVMTPLNPRWEDFERRLSKAIRAEGCDAKSLRLSGRLLAGMGGMDVERSLAYFRANGGHCDCEVLANTAQ